MRLRIFKIISCIIGITCAAFLADAQMLPTSLGDSAGSLSNIAAPSTPGIPDAVTLMSEAGSPHSGERFIVHAETPLFNPDTSVFEWTINGKKDTTISGQAKNAITVTAGSIGTALKIDVTVHNAAGETVSRSLTLWPADISLTWTAKTYTPPWYIGKAMPTANSVVVFTAVPEIIIDGKRKSPESLRYRWSVDEQQDVRSGIGVNTFHIQTANYPGASSQITVIVEDLENRVQTVKSIFITTRVPEVQVFQYSPLGGIESRSGAFFFSPVTGQFLDLLVEPFFFPVQQKRELSYEWTVSGNPQATDASTPYFLSIQTPRFGRETMVPIGITVRDNKSLIPFAAAKVFDLNVQ